MSRKKKNRGGEVFHVTGGDKMDQQKETTSTWLAKRAQEIGQGAVVVNEDGVRHYRPKEEDDDRRGGGDTFYCESVEVEGKCPIFNDKIRVHVPFADYEAWKHLADTFDTEWQAYLTGAYDEESKTWNIDGFYFPPQTASGAHCTNSEDHVIFRDRTVGHLHSHVKMNAFWSGTDLAHANWPVEMVVNNKGHILARTMVKLECGRPHRVDATVFTVKTSLGEEHDALRTQVETLMKRLKEIEGETQKEQEAALKAALEEGRRLAPETTHYHGRVPASLSGSPWTKGSRGQVQDPNLEPSEQQQQELGGLWQ